MRNKRVKKFKKSRHKKAIRIFLLAFIMPFTLVLLGYLVASLLILPSMLG